MSSTSKQRSSNGTTYQTLKLIFAFITGGILCGNIVLNLQVGNLDKHGGDSLPNHATMPSHQNQFSPSSEDHHDNVPQSGAQEKEMKPLSILDGKRILVGIAAYDFSQLPHLEEVLDAYHDLCVAGAQVDVYIHATIAYPVTLLDLLNTRLTCHNPSPNAGLSITIVLVSPRVRLHLVDFHRKLFYQHLEEYDVFIYSEDDIRVTPKTVAAYLHETKVIESIVGPDHLAEYNVGIVRYEYNYPPDIIINDKTRGATENVTRVYWEHSWHPAIPKSVDAVPQKQLSNQYVHMKNHHQGMYLATRDLLRAWRDKKPACDFSRVRDRPGMKNRPSQPTEGTQRVWMSSQMLYGNRHCNVQQVIPMDRFGALTVLHLPNKNYRRVGLKGRLGGKGSTIEVVPSGNETWVSPDLLTAMQLHLEIRKKWKATPQIPYRGIQMVDHVRGRRTPLLERRMEEYQAYVDRGGVLTDEDMEKTALH